MNRSIFSTYKTGENRVTSSIIAVLQSLTLSRTERILGALLEETGFEMVRFQNQPSGGSQGVPDAIISSDFHILLETKTARNAVNPQQLKRHLDRLNDFDSRNKWCIVLTPDASRPSKLAAIDDDRLVWTSFAMLNQSIDDLLSDPVEVISEREAFLLRELQLMFIAESLITSDRNVVVVAAKRAWPQYNLFIAYVCQPNRSFQDVRYIAFYADGEIKPVVPMILESHEVIVRERGRYNGVLGEAVNRIVDLEPNEKGTTNKILLLTAPDDPQTIKLEHPIANDLTSANGITVAFTQGQRYVSLQSLRNAQSTSYLQHE